MMVTLIPTKNITADKAAQLRAGLSQDVVDDYAEGMRENVEFPPVTVFQEGDVYRLADGFHRYEAALKIGALNIKAEVREGTLRDAILYSVSANADHGLRRTNADKRRSVLTLLNDLEWREWSDREIGRRCSVDHVTVGRIRKEVTGDFTSEERRYTTKHGTEAVMNTEHIGVAPAAAPDNVVTLPFVPNGATPAPKKKAKKYEEFVTFKALPRFPDPVTGIVEADLPEATQEVLQVFFAGLTHDLGQWDPAMRNAEEVAEKLRKRLARILNVYRLKRQGESGPTQRSRDARNSGKRNAS